MLKPGWLERQFQKVEKDVKEWPAWMRREAGLDYEYETTTGNTISKERKKRSHSSKNNKG